MVAIRRSSTRIAIEKKLIEVEARIAADRFEREMINKLREERTQILQRLDLNKETIAQLVETEERATSEDVIRKLGTENKDLKAERQDAEYRIGSLSNELERAEKARIAEVLYAKGVED
ncbi:hypothetical protein MJO28_015069 [Puccinia striiformis f. sp. tritici]|uniref:Uncharacterized protein n=1 Tax=Puccinia striiformis f. sp. tritici TaxID=168172 RepID=A0ACC0DRH7_9BASI|nr:hypothetical protein MJO28_015069 [Puccinia striiformis f. sp. tritici]